MYNSVDIYLLKHMIKRIRSAVMKRQGSYSLCKRRMKAVFDEIDVDRDGSLSVRELKLALDELKVKLLV